MGAQGEDVLLSAAARKLFPYAIECKNIAAFAGYKYYDQAVGHAANGATPIAVVKANRREPLVLISLEDFLKLHGSNKDL